MGAAELRAFEPAVGPTSTLTAAQVEILAREGLEIPLDEVDVLEDGTLAYKNQRVVLYIRDVKQYRQNEPSLPRFHVSDCDTLQGMRAKNRYERYVVATRDTGVFQIKLMGLNATRYTTSDKSLQVCQNCLIKLNWNEFVIYRYIQARRAEIVSSFTLVSYFEKYGKTFVGGMPSHTEQTAPENTYTADFAKVAEVIKKKRGYRCGKCGIDLSLWKQYLHAHHKNGMQYNNRESNIEILCIEHHAEEPFHGHMKGAAYKEFLRLKATGAIH
jgi:hypothetical protein